MILGFIVNRLIDWAFATIVCKWSIGITDCLVGKDLALVSMDSGRVAMVVLAKHLLISLSTRRQRAFRKVYGLILVRLCLFKLWQLDGILPSFLDCWHGRLRTCCSHAICGCVQKLINATICLIHVVHVHVFLLLTSRLIVIEFLISLLETLVLSCWCFKKAYSILVS